MIKYILVLLFQLSLFADSDIKTFEISTRPKVHVDAYDFPGSYPQLENISIDATRQMRVTMDLSGSYPVLKKINYEGTFGTLAAKLTGHFPQLDEIAFLCKSTAMTLDLSGKWEKSCKIKIVGGRGDVELVLPKDVGVQIHTKVGLKGRVVNNAFEKQNRGILKKDYINPAQIDSPIQLLFEIEMGEGRVTLN